LDAIIQNRRGDYSEVIPENLRPGEYVVVQQNDPNSDSGQSVYVGIKQGVVKRLAFSNEVGDYQIQAQEAAEQAKSAQSATATMVGQVNTKYNEINTLAGQVATNAQTAQTAAQTATTKANEASQSKTDAQTASQTSVKVLGSMAPAYDATKTYAVGDLVIYDNALKQCNTAITTPEAWNDAHWINATVENELTNLKEDLSNTDALQKLLCDDVPNTIQTYTFTDGAVSQVTHSADNVAVRTDVFTYSSSSITETRTLNSGESLAIVTNLTTLETTVTYNEAEPYEVVYSVTDAVQGAWVYSNGSYSNNGRTDRAGSKMLGYTPQIGDIIRVEDSQRRYKFTTGTGIDNYRITSTDDLVVDQTAMATLKTILFVKADNSDFTSNDLAFLNQNTHVYRQSV